MISESLGQRLFSITFLFIIIALTLGLPLDSWDKFTLLFLTMILPLILPLKLTGKKVVISILIAGTVISFHYINPPAVIEERANVFNPSNPFLKQLPEPIYSYLDKQFQKLYPQNPLGSSNNLYGFFVESFHQQLKGYPKSEGRYKHQITYESIPEARFGFMNVLSYNTYGVKPAREELPFFARYDLPQSLTQNPQTQVCWKGDLFIPQSLSYTHQFAEKETCIHPSEKNISHFYVTSIDPDRTLTLTITPPQWEHLYFWILKCLTILGVMGMLMILFPLKSFQQTLRQNSEKRNLLIILGSTVIFSCLVAFKYKPEFLTGFILFPAGDDALSYASMARIILEALYHGDFSTALMGGESIFDLMPLHRYTYAFNLLLFGETHLGYFLLILFFPIVVYFLIKEIFQSPKAGFILAMIFACIPIFESFGFTQLYIVRLCMRGFAEPLSSLLFVSGILLALPYFTKSQQNLQRDYSRPYIIGLCFFIAVGARPNVLLGSGLFLVGLTYHLWTTIPFKDFLKTTFALGIGFSPFLLIPLHNIYFGKAFVLLTIAGQKTENLGLTLDDYKNIHLTKIFTHLSKEIPISRPWLYGIIFLNIYGLFLSRLPGHIRLLMLTGLGQLSIVFFYRIGGRYSYLHGMILLISALYLLMDMYQRRSIKKLKQLSS